jgi:hypothetical protein
VAAFTKYQDFSEQLHSAVHNFKAAGHTYKIALTNAAPNVATHAVRADITELATGGGYTQNAAGLDIQNDASESGGTTTVTAVDVVVTAAGGTIGPFRYVAIFNDTATSPADALVGYVDYGSAITLNDTETFTTDFGASLFTHS